MIYLKMQNLLCWILTALFCMLSTQTIASGDPSVGEKKSLMCGACHGAKGVSVNPEWPHLAGQHTVYFIKQLHDFKQNTRQGTVMGPLIANLSEQDIEDIAAYYAQLPAPTVTTKADSVSRGETLYRQGDHQQHITACITCHGPDGRGNAPAGFPLLSHQSSLYTQQQLQAFKAGQRHNDLNGIMHDISSHLNDEDIKALASYISTMKIDPTCKP